MYKRILVPLDPSESSKKALDVAIYLAKGHNATLEGLTIIDVPGIESHIGPLPLGASHYAHELQANVVKDAEATIDEIKTYFTKRCDEAGVNFVFHKSMGMPAHHIIEESRFFDLLVIGRETHFNFAISDEAGHTFDKVMAKCVTPIIAVPSDLDEERAFGKNPQILIALDGSLSASRSLLRFCQIISDKTANVNLLMSHNNAELANYILDNSEELLRSYGITKVNKVHTKENIINYVDNNFINNTDLFVMGTHTKSTLKDFFLGSFTAYLIKNANNMLFIGN